MPPEWRETTLGEICESQGGSIQTGPFGSQLHASDYKETGIPVVMPTNIGDGGIVAEGIARIGSDDADRLKQHKLNLGDVVFSRRGDVTRNALIQSHEVGWLCGTGCLKVRLGNESKAKAKFIAYCLRLPETKEWLVRHAVGATMANLNTSILSSVPMLLPPMGIQEEVSGILGALDDKIALLRETNTTLEAIAQALFKSWFVDFDPVRAKAEGRDPEGVPPEVADLFPSEFEESEMGAIPKGWHWSSLGGLADVGIGKTPPRKEPQWFSKEQGHVRWVSIKDMGNCGIYISDSSEYLVTEAVEKFNVRIVPDNTVILSFKMTLGRVCITDGPMCTNEAIAHCKLGKRSPVPPEFLYAALRAFNFDSLSSTSSIADAVNSKSVQAIPVIYPGDTLVNAFGDQVRPLFAGIKARQSEVRSLMDLRDTLLPRLMSGKLRIEEMST